jgi:hypothetical protein
MNESTVGSIRTLAHTNGISSDELKMTTLDLRLANAVNEGLVRHGIHDDYSCADLSRRTWTDTDDLAGCILFPMARLDLGLANAIQSGRGRGVIDKSAVCPVRALSSTYR